MQTVSIISSLVASVLLLFSVLFVLIKDWRDQVNRIYSMVTLSAFGLLFTMFLTYAYPDAIDLTVVNRITQLSTVLTFAWMFCMSFVFPKRERAFPYGYIFLMMLPAFVIAGIAVGTDWNISRAYIENKVLVREFRFFYTVYAVVTFLYISVAVAKFVINYLKTKVAIYRLQMRYVFIGTTVSMLIAAVFSIIMPRFFNYSELYVLGPSIASFIAVGSFFYSVISYQMMDITTAIHKTVMYTIISTLIFLPIFGILWAYDARRESLTAVHPMLVAGSLVGVFLFFSVYVQPQVDRIFKRRQYEFENVINNFIIDVEKIRDFRQLVQRTVDILVDSLFLKNAVFFLFSNETRRYDPLYRRGEEFEAEPVDRNSPLVRWFVRNQEVLYLDRVYTDDRSFGEMREEFAGFFLKNRARLVMPMYHGRRMLGLLCLGDKDSLAGYKPDELVTLQNFQRECNVHLSNALTYEEAIREELVNRTVELSSNIMARSVPENLPNLIGVKFGAFYVPKYKEGVDYFDFLRPGSQGVGVIGTDISGVGITSALNSVVLRSAFQSCVEDAPSAYSVMQKLNRILYDYSEGRAGFITAYYFYYDIKTMRLIYSNAGFPPLDIYRIEKNDFDSLDTEGIPLGYDPEASYGMGRTNLLRGDIGMLYSKALINTKNQRGDEYGLHRLRTVVKENRSGRPFEIANAVKKDFTDFLGLSTPESDIVFIVFKIV